MKLVGIFLSLGFVVQMRSLLVGDRIHCVDVSKSSSNILIPCSGDADCDAIVKDSVCSALLGDHCTCPAGFTFSTDVSKCLKEVSYGEACVEAIQCSHMLTGAECNGVCDCADGLTYVRGRCRKLVNLNEPCRDEIDCFFGYNRESVECRDGKCQCADGFYQRFTNVCRRESINGERCIVNADCIDTDSECKNFVCTASVATQTTSLNNAAVQTTQSLESIGDSHARLEKSASFSNRRYRDYIKYNKLENSDATKVSSLDDESTQFGELCDSENKPCPGLKYSICRRGFCQCQDGFFQKDAICKAELGELAEEGTHCGVFDPRNPVNYQRNRCVCENNQFYHESMRSCVKASLGINNSCTQQMQCSPFGAAQCVNDQPRRCQCYDYATYNEKTQLCELKEGYGEFCEKSESCKVPNTECTTRNTCECKANFVAQNNEECKPGYGVECEENEDCAFDNAECKIEVVDEKETKKCRCKDDFIGIGSSCFEKAKSYNDTCIENDQCKPLLGDKASCNDEKCTCDESLHFKNGQCEDKKELEEKCTKSGECFVQTDPETVECRNGFCRCKFEFSSDTNQNRCIRPREKNSSKSTSPLKVVTLMLIASAVVITGSALRDAYYP